MKCEGYGHIQAECANIWIDDESKACNEREDIYNRLVALVNLSIEEQCSSDLTISKYGQLVDPSTYKSSASMTELG